MNAPRTGSAAVAGRAPRERSALVIALALSLPALIPLFVVFTSLLTPEASVWSHLAEHVLPRVLWNTLALVVGVAIAAGVLGTALAWLTSMCDFPGRKFFSWALLLPLAIPAYVLAFIAVGFLDYAGPLQTWIRSVSGHSNWFPAIRSTGGVIFVLTLALYPYVYLLARGAFLSQGRRAQEAARTLGMSSRRAFWRVVLPMARPWIAAGIALACMETLADFGAVSVFNYDTFTTAIYRAWFGMFSIDAALELAAALLVFVIVMLAIERRSRARARFGTSREMMLNTPRSMLSGWRANLATAFAGVVFAIAFLLPMLQLLSWAIAHAGADLDIRYWGFVLNSVVLASSAAVTIVAVASLLAYLQRRAPTRPMHAVVRAATLGYAIPGTVLAVGILVPVIALNNFLQDSLRDWFSPQAPVLMLQGTLLTVLVAYFARFLAVGFHPIESGLHRITPSIDEAAIGLGVSGLSMLKRVHVPLLRTSLAAAAALVFVDVMKEMPITLIARPFGWDTLAVRVFEMTAEGEWERAALPALAIVLVGLVPVAMLTRRGEYVA